MENTKTRDPIPEFETLEDIAEFWDTHSTADYDDLTREVQFEVRLHKNAEEYVAVSLLPELSETIQALARARRFSRNPDQCLADGKGDGISLKATKFPIVGA